MEVSDLVWLQTGFLGDIVLTTAAISLGAEYFPLARHHLVTTQIGFEALEGLPQLSNIVVWDKRSKLPWISMQKAAKEVRRGLKGEAVYCLRTHPSTRSAILARCMGYKTISHRESNLSRISEHVVDRVAVLHEAQRIGLLLEPLGVPREAIISARPTLKQSEQPQKDWASAVLRLPLKKIGIAPGSVWGTKRWTQEGFRWVIRRFLKEEEIGIVLMGGAEEALLVERIMAEIGPHPRVVNTAGLSRIRELRWLIPQLSVLLANDSAPIHFASAFNIPTVAVFGATVSQMGFGPLAVKQTIIENTGLRCRPCGAHGPQYCPLSHFECMRSIRPEQVYQALVELL